MTRTSRKVKVVIDTNILLASISGKSKYNWIFQKIIKNEIELAISNDILSEYEEKLSVFFNSSVAKNTIDLLIISENVIKIAPYFNWSFIDSDKDDNKFIDCAIAANADYIVTNDRHFNILKKIDFPKVNVLNIDEFSDLFKLK